MSDLNAVYHERNMLVAYLATCYPAHLARHPAEQAWEDDWRWLVCVHTPAGQMTWHIHDSEYPLFGWLPERAGDWDGHTTEEKYTCLLGLIRARGVTDGPVGPAPGSGSGAGRRGQRLNHTLFAMLCDLVNALCDLEAAMPPSRHQDALHALIHRFDEVLDTLVELEWPGERHAPANDREGPWIGSQGRPRWPEEPC